ncbi:MAG: hypothetical protein HYR50_04600, partial [Candidatus Rokubacteria bacterium]|nr:hypothetical protein [Candidatus Rokubacteria bacterium]
LILKGARVNGQVELRQAVIEGQIYADGLAVSAIKDETAIRADGIRVGDDIFLRGCQLKGQARFAGAHVGGNVELDGATLENGGATALTLEQAEIGGKVFLRSNRAVSPQVDFHSIGEVRLLDAKLGGELSCAGAIMENPGGRALTCDRARVDGSVFLTQGFRAHGEVRFAGARIGSNLEFQGALLENPKGYALFALDVDVKGALMLCGVGAKPLGRINLDHAVARVFFDDTASWPSPGQLEINGFRYTELGFTGLTRWSTRLQWLRLQSKQPFRSQPYEQLAQVLRSMGRPSDAKAILAARQDDLRRYGELRRHDRFTNWLLGVTVGHGYFPGRIWWWVAGSIGLALCTYTLFYWSGVLVPESAMRWDALWLQLLLLAVGKFLPIANIGIDSVWRVDSTSLGGGLLRLFEVVYRIDGWALTALAAAALTGLIKKK